MRETDGTCTIFVLDGSASIRDNERLRAERFVDEAMQRLTGEDLAGVVLFGKDPVVESTPSLQRSMPRVMAKVETSASDPAAAVRLASASFPDGKNKRIVLITDGNETDGDLRAAAEVAAQDKIPIEVVRLGTDTARSEVSILELQSPSESRKGEPFELRAILDSSKATSGRLVVDRDGVVVYNQPVSLRPGRNAIVVSDKLDDPGFMRYRATFQATEDGDSRNNVGLGFVGVRGESRILVMQESRTPGTLTDALRRKGLKVDVLTPGRLPLKAEQLQPYDAIILNDLNADKFFGGQMEMIRSAVRDSGIGLAMIGGENSFLSGGYYGSPIADALPVDLDVRQKKVFPSTSILILVDASGSMSVPEDGIPKIRLAAKAAEETVNLLSARDRVGVGGSTDGIELVAPMASLTDKAAVISQVRKLDVGGGGIYIEPTMRLAMEVLMKEPSRVRHHILLADGNDADSQEGAIPIALAMRSKQITTTVVSIGGGKDVAFLRQLAAAGGGRFYLADKASKLPAIFTQDTAIMGRSAIEDGVFLPKIAQGEPILKGINSSGIPALLAYCLTEARPLARVGMRTPKDDPLLASWTYGLAESLAFTSDAQPRWAAKWVEWPGFDAFWSQAARTLLRRSTRNAYDARVEGEGGKGKVVLEAVDSLGNPATQLEAKVTVSSPSGDAAPVTMIQTGPGKFEGAFSASNVGSYIVSIAETDADGKPRVSTHGFSIPYPPEYRSFRTNTPLLEKTASLTGGRLLTKPEQAAAPLPKRQSSLTDLWTYFVFAAALLLPLDVAVRRIALPVHAIWSGFLGLFRRRQQKVEVTVSIGRLSAAKQRVAHRSAPPAAAGEARKVEMSAPDASREPAGAAKKPGGQTASQLLDAKRKRKG
ncbi:MAG: hypothetical protein HONBIEJF_01680 [Fimbriimonadaceae bacterium]|nr:hypothetical protein [Fimbriimonadaceae bacterium]